MKNKILLLLYSGLLGCTAPKVMVPEVIIGGTSVTVTVPREPSVLPPKPSLEEMAVYVVTALKEIKEQKGIDGIALSGAVSFSGENYGYDYEYDTSFFCDDKSIQPIGKGRLTYQFLNSALERTAAGSDPMYKRIEITVRDLAPFGTTDDIFAVVVINDSVKLNDRLSVWKEAQQFYAAMLKDTYTVLQTHRNKKGAWSSFELDKIRDQKNEELDFTYKKFMETLYSQEPESLRFHIHCLP